MLQAEIAIVDEDGQTEESMTIFGTGRVSLGARTTGGFLHADEAETDLAIVTRDGAMTLIEMKVPNALSGAPVLVGHTPMLLVFEGSFDMTFFHAWFIEPLQRRLEVKHVLVDGDLVQGNAMIHRTARIDPMASSLVLRAHALLARGAIEVTQELRELREQGKIDENGDLLVPWPDDMRPDSSTDL